MTTSKNHQNQESILVSFDQDSFDKIVSKKKEGAQNATSMTIAIKNGLNFTPTRGSIIALYSGSSIAPKLDIINEELKASMSDQLNNSGLGVLISDGIVEMAQKKLKDVIIRQLELGYIGVTDEFDYDGEKWTVKQSVIDLFKQSASNYADTPGRLAVYHAHQEYVKATQALYSAVKANLVHEGQIGRGSLDDFLKMITNFDENDQVIAVPMEYRMFK